MSRKWYRPFTKRKFAAPRAGKMNQIARCNWLPEWERWTYLARSGLPAVSRKNKSHIIKSFIDQSFSVKMAGYWSRSFFASLSTSMSSRSIKELGQYPAIFTSRLVSNPYILTQKMSGKITTVNNILTTVQHARL